MGTPQETVGTLTGGSLRNSFPSDVLSYPFACMLRFSKYSREISGQTASSIPLATIILPLPMEISETLSPQYGDTNFSKIAAGIMSAIVALKQGTPLDDVLKDRGLQGAAISGLAGLIPGASGFKSDIEGVVNQFTGAVINPHLTTLFTGVPLRNFTYHWNFSPRSSDEAVELSRIYKYIKSSSLPRRDPGGFSLLYPNEVQIDFVGNGIEYFIPGTKRTVIENVSLSYTPGGHTALYKNGSPVNTTLSIQLKEIAIRTAEDFDES